MKRKRLFSMLVFIGLILLGTAIVLSYTAERDLELKCHYYIEAEVFPEKDELIHTTRVSIQNDSSVSVNTLFFHLYGNLYRENGRGIIEVLSVSTDDEPLRYSMRRNQQLICVRLGEPLTPGEIIEIDFQCLVDIPELEERIGTNEAGEIIMPLFYPQLAVCDENGWDKSSLNGIGDGRYSEIADYTVMISCPEDYQIACGGTMQNFENIDGSNQYVFEACDRRDIAFSAFDNYTYLEENLGDVEIKGYFGEGCTLEAANDMLEAAVFALDFYSQTFIEYPYDTLVIITNGQPSRRPVSMEYSGFITIPVCEQVGFDELEVLFHEIAHQWFYGIVGNDEDEEPWLDEGFATFATGLCLDEYGVHLDGIPYWGLQEMQAQASEDRYINISANKQRDYIWTSYGRGCHFLKCLMERVGKERFLNMLSEYCRANYFENVTTEEFLSCMQQNDLRNVKDIIETYISNS